MNRHYTYRTDSNVRTLRTVSTVKPNKEYFKHLSSHALHVSYIASMLISEKNTFDDNFEFENQPEN